LFNRDVPGKRFSLYRTERHSATTAGASIGLCVDSDHLVLTVAE
jgi:hypothetical protein